MSFVSDVRYDKAIEMIFARMRQIASESDSRFPLFREVGGEWKLSRRGSWLAGFWPGSWLLKNSLCPERGDLVLVRNAWSAIERLEPVDSVNSAFVHFYAFADAPDALDWNRACIRRAVAHKKASFNQGMRAFPLGEDMGGGKQGRSSISIDSLAPLVGLSTLSMDAGYLEQLKQHIVTTCQALIGPDGRCANMAIYRDSVWRQPPGSAWQRAQAWGILGFSYASLYLDADHCHMVKLLLDHWMTIAESISLELEGEREPLDYSSLILVIFSIYLLRRKIKSAEYLSYADKNLDAILNRYLKQVKNQQNAGAFYGCLYDLGAGNVQPVETVWVMYFFVKALILRKTAGPLEEGWND